MPIHHFIEHFAGIAELQAVRIRELSEALQVREIGHFQRETSRMVLSMIKKTSGDGQVGASVGSTRGSHSQQAKLKLERGFEKAGGYKWREHY